MAGGALWFARLPQPTAVTLFFVLMAIRALASGLVATPWQEMIAKVIPVQWRGRFFGVSHSLGGALGLIGSAIATFVLARWPYPTNFALCFLIGFMLHRLVVDRLDVHRRAGAAAASAPCGDELPQAALGDFARRSQFPRISDEPWLGYLGGMSFGFLAVYGVEQFQLADAQAADLYRHHVGGRHVEQRGVGHSSATGAGTSW